ncbi:zinc finger protein 8-like isoform X2 [Lineus longissimus]
MNLKNNYKNTPLPHQQVPAKDINGMEEIDHQSEVKEFASGPSLDNTPRFGELIDHPYMSTDQDHDKKLRNKTKNKAEKIKLFTCVFCYKSFSQQYILNRHLPVHTDDRKYGCSVCGKMFRQASTLCRHKVVHTNEKRYACKSCDKSFNRVSTLIAHEKIHVGDKAYICPTCGKGFHQKGNLKNHIFTHTGEKPYVCKIESCGKSFNQLSNLSVHMTMKHKEEVCVIPDKGVKTLAEVKAQSVASHKERCDICDMSFNTEAELKTHKEEKHLIMHVMPPPGRVANNSEQTVREGEVIVASSVGRAVNDPHCRTITLPNGDKTIMPTKRKQNAKGLDCWYDMDDNVRAAASILMELESSSGVQVQSPKAVQDMVIVESVAIEQEEPACSQNNMEIHLVETGMNTVESDAVQTGTVANVSSVLPAGLHKIGTTDDGQMLALLVKVDGTCSLVKVPEKGPTPMASQASEEFTSLLVSPAGGVEGAEISPISNIPPPAQPHSSSQFDISGEGQVNSVLSQAPGGGVTNSLDSFDLKTAAGQIKESTTSVLEQNALVVEEAAGDQYIMQVALV